MRRIATKLLVLFLLIMVLGVLSGCGKTIPAGHRGVYFNWRAGTDTGTALTEGWNWLAPWNRIYLYDVRVKDQQEDLSILTRDQLNIKCDLSIRFQPVADKVGILHQNIGPEYYTTIVRPTVRNVTREVIAGYDSIDAYTKRSEIQDTIFKGVVAKLDQKPIAISAIMLRNMDFPRSVTDAIERKLAMKQEAEKMKFVLEKERLEAERKRVEARGIADFQIIVTKGINENLLRWKGIEATLKLAESQNSKVVVIGGAGDGLPLILGK
ncbi:MAG: prohibitin family protein [Candidatus Lernaella stagnicola]|nr:prohibitin family protein [Candidatus Lernaella stagnicola]